LILQDAALGGGALVLIALLLPTLLDSRAAVPLATSATTGAVLALYAAVYVSLGLALAAAGSAATAALWFLVAAFRRTGPRRNGAVGECDRCHKSVLRRHVSPEGTHTGTVTYGRRSAPCGGRVVPYWPGAFQDPGPTAK
jgi:hypothetical protein